MKKGFTLIELLAVIVILAIIVLVATPIVTGIIEKSRKGSAESSAYGYLESLDEVMITGEIISGKSIEKERIYKVEEDTEYEYSELEYLNEHPNFNKEASEIYLNSMVKIKGELPTDGYVIIGEKEVEEAELVINGYVVYCDKNRRCVSTGKYTSSSNVTSVKIEERENYVVTTGNEIELKATVETVDGTEAKVTWTSSDSAVATVNNKGVVKGIKEGQVTIIAKSGNKKSRVTITVINDSILGYISDTGLKNDSIVEIKTNGEVYTAHVYVYEGNQVFSEDKVFGDANDVGTETTEAQNMVIVKVNGDLTINEGVTVSPYYTEYGGPKGFTIYVTGTLINNGTIDNSHGAKATGQNVYLWKNSDGTYEMVEANSESNGRQTGSGGNGGAYGATPGVGSKGTSYSGGTGGGGNYNYNGATSGITNGGSGGIGAGKAYSGGGGSGNPGGIGGYQGVGNNELSKGENGTGGLLLIYSNDYINNGTISAQGSSGGTGGRAGGGGSGGGTINIFTNKKTNIDKTGINVEDKMKEMMGNVVSLGGSGGKNTDWSSSYGAYGVSGETGTVNIGEIRNGQYYDLKEIINQDIEAYNK